MSDDRLLGELLAHQKQLREDVSEIKKDLKSLNEFRWAWTSKLTAYTGLVASVVTFVVEYFISKR